MSLKRYMILPAGIAVVAVLYWFLSYETAGSVLLVVFAGAMALMGWILLPTASNAGPTAQIDPDWHEREQ
jgi:ATP/ADP translocase